MKFSIGTGLKCDLATLIDTRGLIQANSGGGKSWILRRLLEQTHGHVQHIVLDPEGEFSSLREKFDYVLAAKQGGDTAADPRAAKLLAHRLLELKVSAIVDLYELHAHERVRFVRLFLEALVDAPKSLWHPALIVLDEAHVFCPEKGQAESAGAVIDLATRGRKRGFCALLATQRIAKLHKDAAAELNNKLIGRTGQDIDIKRAADELGFSGRDQSYQLRDLEPGEFFGFGPAISRSVTKVKVGPVETTHPKAGARRAFEAPKPTKAILELLPQLADLPAEAEQKAKSEADLKRDLAAARAEVTRLKNAAPVRIETETKVERVEVAMITDGQVQALQACVRDLRQAFEQTASGLDRLVVERGELGKVAHQIESSIAQAVRRPDMRRDMTPVRKPVTRVAPAVSPGDEPVHEQGQPSGVEQRILNALAELEAIGAELPSRELVATMAGYSHTSSKGFANAIGHLRTSGLVDYPQTGSVALTEAGRAQSETADAPVTAQELHERVMRVIGGSAERILRPLVDAYPDSVPIDALLEASGYGHQSSKGFANALGRLRSLGFVSRRGAPTALPVLFPAGLA